MASGPFVWGPHPGVPIWTPYSPYASPFPSPYTTPYTSPYASPIGGANPFLQPSPFVPNAHLWQGAPFATPYPPFAPGLATPYTPPGATPGASPSALLPGDIPPPFAKSVQVAPWLAYNPYAPQPAIVWDVAAEPARARHYSEKLAHLVPLAPKFGEQATYPGAVEKLEIVVDGIDTVAELWGAIEVSGPDPTVGDILRAVHGFFEKRMSRDEVDKIKAMKEGNWERLVQAMAERCRRAPGLAEYEWSQGLRRVDCLGENTAWGGLRVEYKEDGTWQLRLTLVPVSKE